MSQKLTLEQVARLAGCSRTTVRKAINDGTLAADREGLVPVRDVPGEARAGLRPRTVRWKIAARDANAWAARYRAGTSA